MNTYNSLDEVVENIKNRKEKLVVLYGFNGTGKTRLSTLFKEKVQNEHNKEKRKIFYYNAYTEDLFNWDNDLDGGIEKKIKIKSSSFINLIKDFGKEKEISEKFKEITRSRIEPNIDISTSEVTFTLPTGDDNSIKNIKISRAEESAFIWALFYVLIETAINELSLEINERSTDEFNNIEYIYIDDPVSSFDDNHIIELAVDLIELITKAIKDNNLSIKFIISTHHTLFYNILYNEAKNKIKQRICYFLKKDEKQPLYLLEEEKDNIITYHLKIKKEIEEAIKEKKVEKYHFMLFRNLLEKTANYLGYKNWGDLINLIIGDKITDDNRDAYIRRINLYSHMKFSEFEYSELENQEKKLLEFLFKNFKREFKWEGYDDAN